MPYPVFEIESIKTRCANDIAQFLSVYNTTDNTGLILTTENLANKASLDAAISPIVEYMNVRLPNNAEYVHEISHLEPQIQNELWIARTYLFYQLLIFTTVSLQNPTLYTEIFSSDKDPNNKMTFSYRDDIPAELKNFKMGIFGSITPTSDIDIGIQYSGNTLQTPALAYIVSRYESLFLIFTQKSSLAFDIETYADMMTIPNPNENQKHEQPDYFYLDSSKFTEAEFIRMLPCAGKSIIRNLFLADTTQVTEVADANFDKILSLPEFQDFYKNVNDESTKAIIQNPKWYNDVKMEIETFLYTARLDYNKARYQYYEKVETAEKLKFERTKNLSSLTPSQICDVMVAIGDALTYRMESYVCSTTVIHVVRILQAAKDKKEKYKTLMPLQYCNSEIQNIDAYCTIGKYGFLLSTMEQIGYIYRFHLTYCMPDNPEHFDQNKCDKKKTKYMDRYNDAWIHYKKYLPSTSSKPSTSSMPSTPSTGMFSFLTKKSPVPVTSNTSMRSKFSSSLKAMTPSFGTFGRRNAMAHAAGGSTRKKRKTHKKSKKSNKKSRRARRQHK